MTATLDAYPDWQIPARVITTIPAADRQKATVKVRIGFDQLDPRILPDMGVKVAFLGDATESAADGAAARSRCARRRRCAGAGQDVRLRGERRARLERRAVSSGAGAGRPGGGGSGPRGRRACGRSKGPPSSRDGERSKNASDS